MHETLGRIGLWIYWAPKMPDPSRNTRDGSAATKPFGLAGARFCSGRPVIGRAAVCFRQRHEESPRAMLFHWRSRVKTIYSPEVWIITKSAGNIPAGSTLRFLLLTNERSPRRENWGGFDEKVCVCPGAFHVRAAGAIRSRGTRHCF